MYAVWEKSQYGGWLIPLGRGVEHLHPTREAADVAADTLRAAGVEAKVEPAASERELVSHFRRAARRR